MYIKQSTNVNILVGPFIDSTDGTTPLTALSIGASDVLIGKFGSGALSAKHSSVAPSHISNGYYSVDLDATDTNTIGQLIIVIQVSGALPLDAPYTLLSASSYEAFTNRATMDINYTDD